jgi:hypothetical protein
MVICPQFLHSTFPPSGGTKLRLKCERNIPGFAEMFIFLSQVPAALTLQQYWTGQLMRSAETLSAAKKYRRRVKKVYFCKLFPFCLILGKCRTFQAEKKEFCYQYI